MPELEIQFSGVSVVVDAKQESINFYQKLGFIPLKTIAGELGDRPQPQSLCLSIKTIEKVTGIG